MKYPKIKFCLTSSRRVDLLKITINSFLETCSDLDLISEYHIFDDRTSVNQLQEIKSMFPQFTIHTMQRQGQAHSINEIWRFLALTNEDWYFHCEDDWRFVNKGNYIREMFDIINLDPKIKNVILRGWKGVKIITKDLLYRAHTYKILNNIPNLSPQDRHRFCFESTDNQWYGYSFNPGILSTNTMLEIGYHNENYNLQGRGWDKAHARLYLDASHKRANTEQEHIQHIGENRSLFTHT